MVLSVLFLLLYFILFIYFLEALLFVINNFDYQNQKIKSYEQKKALQYARNLFIFTLILSALAFYILS